MSESDSELSDYRKDPRIACKYGSKCYQKNSTHINKYKHPPKTTKRKDDAKAGPSKKLKLEDSDQREVKSDTEDKIEETKEQIMNEHDDSNEREDNEEETRNEKRESTENSPLVENEDQNNEATVKKPFDAKLFIKAKFLINMPDDFYDFWEFCKELKPNNPCDAFKNVDLKLVGAFDVLAGNFKHVKISPEEYLRHWRYYYDPPELHTVLKGNDSTGYHIGYFYDSPDEPPPFLLSNYGTKDGVFTKMGDNIFAAVSTYLEELKKSCDPFKKMHIGKLLTSLKNKAEKLNLDMSLHSLKIKKRETHVVAKTSNKIGLVVPYNKKTQLGYRDLAVSDKELMKSLDKLKKAAPEQKAKFLSDLQHVLTSASIALDECDFGTGIKLGWEILYHGIDSLDSTISRFLCDSYKLLNREAFAKITEAHLGKRRKGCDLSILKC